MRRRFGINHGLLAGAGVILAVMLGDYLYSTLTDRSELPPPPVKGPYDPDFKEGGRAPDFTLPDAHGRQRKLSALVPKEALLSFVSDDERSRALMRYVASLARVRRKQGKPLPAFIAVADFKPEREASFLRDTGLDQVVLYEGRGKAAAEQYRADKRPRCFQLQRNLVVAVIGSSPAAGSLFELGNEVRIGWSRRSPALVGTAFEAPEPAELRRFDPPRTGRKPAPDAAATGS